MIWYHGVEMWSSLTEEAHAIGIQAVGVGPAVGEAGAAYPWARSVVSVAVSYLPPEPGPAPDGARGLVARFARGADYHEVVRSKLEQLAIALESAKRVEICVDTCPLPERKLAVLSGLGWLGKNCCLFVDGCGSYVALGEIVTDMPAGGPAPVLAKRCGDCRRCLDACPTGALTAPGVVDRSKCLSHITQAGGEIASELRAIMGNRVYGCDVCQEVCPHNQGLVPVNAEFAEDRFPGAYPDLGFLLSVTKGEFDSVIRPSSIGWIGRSRLRRNAAIAAENLSGGS